MLLESAPLPPITAFAKDYAATVIGHSLLVHADCLEWLSRVPENSVHAIVTDPPYGVKEYHFDELEKREGGKIGIWRLPPAFDGSNRQPLPRFTALTPKERDQVYRFFYEWARLALRVLRPGGHVFLASNSFLSHHVFAAVMAGGFEFRGEMIRLVRTLRGGDRPKNAENEFADVASLPRGCYEPWGIFRKPLPAKMRVADCLREFATGGLRRRPDGSPLLDVIVSERTPRSERRIANHPSIKPQSFMRQLVYASLPLGQGIILDPFAGSGATVAAAEACGLTTIGIERYDDYYQLAQQAIPRLARLAVNTPKPLVQIEDEDANAGDKSATIIPLTLPFA